MGAPRFVLPFKVKNAANQVISCELVVAIPADATAWAEIIRTVTALAPQFTTAAESNVVEITDAQEAPSTEGVEIARLRAQAQSL